MRKLVNVALVALTVACFGSLVRVDSARADTVSDEKEAIRTLAKSVCSTCHGNEGRSADTTVPNIAGQRSAYIEAQLKAFRYQRRREPEAHDYMWGIASNWLYDDKVVAGVADYFFSQPPAPGKPGEPAILAIGKQLYEKGSADRSIRGCAECHGKNGEGLFFFPRLTGQHAQYLKRQMQMFRVKLRDSPVMHSVIKDLTDEDITALSAYLQSK